MSKLMKRRAFADWIDRLPEGDPRLLPLTHITNGIRARRIIEDGTIAPTECGVLELPLSYFFYGRPAYRLMGGSSVKLESSCPFCFIFDGEMIKRAREIFAFDTGAFATRMYDHVFDPDFELGDFSLGTDSARPNKLIGSVYRSILDYIEGDRNAMGEPAVLALPHEFEARAYLELIKSPGRNEPDDRICSIEVNFGDLIPVPGQLVALALPHTLCEHIDTNPWLRELQKAKIDLLPYNFSPGRPPENYHALLEGVVRNYYVGKGFL